MALFPPGAFPMQMPRPGYSFPARYPYKFSFIFKRLSLIVGKAILLREYIERRPVCQLDLDEIFIWEPKRDIIGIEGTFYLKGEPLVVSRQPRSWNQPANIAGRRLQ